MTGYGYTYRRPGDGQPWRLDLGFAPPTPPKSENDLRGKHWAVVRSHLAPWKTAAWAATHNARVRHTIPQEPILVTLTLPFKVERTRDPHNYVGTVVKAVVDGIVRAGLVPDDDPAWVTVTEPRLVVTPPPHQVGVTIQPRETP